MRLSLLCIFWVLIGIIEFNMVDCQSQSLNATQTQNCTNSFQCKETLCCYRQKCEPNDTCQTEKKLVYVGIGIVGFVFLLLSLIYMIYTINTSKKNVAKLKLLNEAK